MNTATVTTPDGADYNLTNNSATDSDGVVRLSASKIGTRVTGPDASGVYVANYQITITNPAPVDAVYGQLIDSVDFPAGIQVLGASWTCTTASGVCTSSSSTGVGPFTIAATNTPVSALTTHTYDLNIRFQYADLSVVADCASGSGLSNTVSLPDGQEEDTASNTACLNPPSVPSTGLSLIKTATAAQPNTANTPVIYSFTLTNTGVITLSDLVVADDKLTTDATCQSLTLAPGASTTCTGIYMLTQADIDNGQTENTATASGTLPTGTILTSSPSTAVITHAQTPSLVMAKSAGQPSVSAAGGTLPYTFTVTNTGNVTLTDVSISDELLDEEATCQSLTLSPGATTICTGLRTLPQSDIDNGRTVNTATASGTPPLGAQVGRPPLGNTVVSGPSTTVTQYTQAPSIQLLKQAGTPTSQTAGASLPFTFTVTNTGNVTLSAISIDDDLLDGPAVCVDLVLDPSASTTCSGLRTLTQAEINAGVTENIATVVATAPGQTTPIRSLTSRTVTNYDFAPALTLDKVALQDTYQWAGDVVSYQYRLTNSGNVTINDLVVTDDRISNVVCPQDTIEPAQVVTCTADYVVTQDDIELGYVTNIATATGTPIGGTLEAARDTATVQATIVAALGITKTATLTRDAKTAGLADADDEITYAVVVTNTGNVNLIDIQVQDVFQNQDASLLDCAPLVLAPGQQSLCAPYVHVVTRTEANLGGVLENVATVRGVPARGNSEPVQATDQALMELADPTTLLRVVKQATPRDVRVGDIVRYSVSIENIGLTDADDVTLFDTPPAGFTLVENSLTIADRDGQGRLSGNRPFRVDQIDVNSGERATITYLLRVGASVRPGNHVNEALAQDGEFSSNTATAEVRVIGDPLLDDSLVIGTVYDDRDADGWQDTAHLDAVKIIGGLAPEVLNGPALINGQAAATTLGEGLSVARLASRQSIADIAPRLVISQNVTEPLFNDSFTVTSAQGVTLRMAQDGTVTRDLSGEAARGLTAADPSLERRVSATDNGYRVDYVLSNNGIDERGIAGVRVASVEGLLIETDPYGRYHLEGVQGGDWERGRNFILSVDPASLPQGSVFTTENPRLRRITPGLPVRFDFGVQLPVEVIGGGTHEAVMKLAEIVFAPGSAEVRPIYASVLDHMAAEIKSRGAGDIVVTANGETRNLAFARAVSVRNDMATRLSADELAQLTLTVQTDREDTQNWVARITDAPVLGNVLFDTDKWAIRPEFGPLLDEVARTLEAAHAEPNSEILIRLVGHTDLRASDAYNLRLGLRRSQAVFEALASRLSPSLRNVLRVEITNEPSASAAPVGR